MPEIGEVARIVHYIRKHLINKTVTKVTAYNDDIVYGKVGTSATEFEKQMKGKKIMDAGQQGKYFWMIMSSPPHPVMHFGMSGWFKIKSEHTYYYRKKADEAADEWPPKYVKFLLETKDDNGTEEAAFVDGRRLGRIRLLSCDGKEIRKHTPLKENGPDPVIDKDLVSLEWLTEKCRKKKVPIKAMLLDQAVISGIGNWVGDEIMYNAKMHPEQYCNTLSDSQLKQLHKSIHYVCGLACELLADSEKFPQEWLFKHRWGKGKKTGGKTLPNGNKIEFLTVGGRTSAVVPAVQKKSGPVAGDLDDATEEEKPKKPKKTTSKKRKAAAEEEEDTEEDTEESEESEEFEKEPEKPKAKGTKSRGAKAQKVGTNGTETARPAKRGKKTHDAKKVEEPETAVAKRKKPSTVKKEKVKEEEPIKSNAKTRKATTDNAMNGVIKEEDTGRRRSGRLRK